MSAQKATDPANGPTNGPTLPARVRVSCPPLPLAAALAGLVRRFFPPLADQPLSAVALAIAGGKVIGAAVQVQGEAQSPPQLYLEPQWRGRGIEQALAAALAQARTA